ncbi:MAG: helix-turn-helix domain-containing protein [Candidatus Paceibacterota bacterium]|jgi:sugar-specific transcriptional regulator TrmB
MNTTKENYLDILKNGGLDPFESKVYFAALEMGDVPIHKLAKEAGINRTSAYAIVDRLKTKGLLSCVKKSSKIFVSAVSPDKLLSLQKEAVVHLEKNIQTLRNIFSVPKPDSGVTHFEGAEGMKNVFNMIINEAKEISIFGDGDSFQNSVPGIAEQYSELRVKKGIKTRLLLKGTPDSIAFAKKLRHSETSKSKLFKVRVLPESYKIVGGFDTYAHKAIFYSFDEKNTAVVVENSIISTLMLTIFDLLWNIAEVYDHTLLKA